MGRKKTPGNRTPSGRKKKPTTAAERRNAPPDYILERRALFSFVTPAKGPDGRVGEIDQDICDCIGQLHALGLFDGHGYDPIELRDRGREYANLYHGEYVDCAPRIGKLEPSSRSSSRLTGLNARDSERYHLMHDAMPRGDYSWLLSMIGDRGDSFVPWAQSIIDYALIERKKLPKHAIIFPTGEDYARLHAVIRCLCAVVEATVAPRWSAAA